MLYDPITVAVLFVLPRRTLTVIVPIGALIRLKSIFVTSPYEPSKRIPRSVPAKFDTTMTDFVEDIVFIFWVAPAI